MRFRESGIGCPCMGDGTPAAKAGVGVAILTRHLRLARERAPPAGGGGACARARRVAPVQGIGRWRGRHRPRRIAAARAGARARGRGGRSVPPTSSPPRPAVRWPLPAASSRRGLRGACSKGRIGTGLALRAALPAAPPSHNAASPPSLQSGPPVRSCDPSHRRGPKRGGPDSDGGGSRTSPGPCRDRDGKPAFRCAARAGGAREWGDRARRRARRGGVVRGAPDRGLHPDPSPGGRSRLGAHGGPDRVRRQRRLRGCAPGRPEHGDDAPGPPGRRARGLRCPGRPLRQLPRSRDGVPVLDESVRREGRRHCDG